MEKKKNHCNQEEDLEVKIWISIGPHPTTSFLKGREKGKTPRREGDMKSWSDYIYKPAAIRN